MAKKKKDKLVMVEWEDTQGTFRWQTKGDPKPSTSLCKTVGFLYENNKKHVALYGSLDTFNGNIGDQNCIPKGCVKRIIRLSAKKKD